MLPIHDALVCDSHMHVFQMAGGYNTEQTRIAAEVPAGEFEEYRDVVRRLGIRRSIVVQPSHFGTDNRTTLAAVRALGGNARAVVIPSPEAGDAEIAHLAAAGAVAARVFLLRDTGLGAAHLERFADRIAPFGWHLEVQCEGHELAMLLPLLARLPVPSVIDHLGRMPKDTRAEDRVFGALLDHLSTPRGWVKISAPYHNSRGRASGFGDLRGQVEAVAQAAPSRIVWATNWPHVQFVQKPDDLALANELLQLLPDATLVRRVLVDNPAVLYRFA